MATDIVPGLFGLDPNQIQAQRQTETDKAAYQYAQMDPFARASMSMYKAGAGLARPIAGMMGGYDPQEREAAQNKDIQSQIDHTTADGLMQGAQLFQQAGNPRMAAMYVQAAQAMKDKESTRALQSAQAQKAAAYQPAGARDYEYEKMIEIIRDPESTDEDKDYARKRIEALNAKATRAGGSTGNAGSSQIVFGPNGEIIRAEKGIGGRVEVIGGVTAASTSPQAQADLAEAKAGAKKVAEGAADAQLAIPKMEWQVKQTNTHIDEVLNHPGMSGFVGMGLPAAEYIPGSAQADMKARFDQLLGESFSISYETLRGGGQITEMETRQAGNAINRMNKATSEKEFRAAAEDFRNAVNAGLDILRKKSAMRFQTPGQQPAQAQQVAPQPVAQQPVVQPQQTTAPFSAKTPAQVKALLSAKRISREQARAILLDMKSQGMEIK